MKALTGKEKAIPPLARAQFQNSFYPFFAKKHGGILGGGAGTVPNISVFLPYMLS
ncbi:MAG: hypothetical protein LBH14_07355 [Desulfobulbaceae bacterium]|jgi:hypothetical protein|nr:hypothetical protein [Desulfobulbaceae bacterium]